ncbi:MAG: AAA family ATPase [Pseudomonadota bacterium]
MYLAHFGLRELPFNLTPDTSFFFADAIHQEALNTLLVAVRNGEGFIKITGEVGTGKTLLCRQFLASINPDASRGQGSFVTAYIPNPYLEPHTLLLAVAEEIGIRLDKDANQYQLTKALTLALLNFARAGKRVVLCLDEAQALPVETLDAIRLLSNLETGKRKLLQIVLFGQPELDVKLNQAASRQLNQRIVFHHRLTPMKREDIEHYVAHRLGVARYTGGELFTRAAIRQLYDASGGIPRLVNIIAHKSLMLAYGEGVRQISARHVRTAAKDTETARHPRLRGWLWALALGAVFAGAVFWWWRSMQ